jgi:hypothetical protein
MARPRGKLDATQMTASFNRLGAAARQRVTEKVAARAPS